MIPFTIAPEAKRLAEANGWDPAELLGLIPHFLSADDPRPAKEQFHVAYEHGGGWKPSHGWTFTPGTGRIEYKGDPPLKPVADAWLRQEHILVYESAWVCIVQPDGSFEVSRMD